MIKLFPWLLFFSTGHVVGFNVKQENHEAADYDWVVVVDNDFCDDGDDDDGWRVGVSMDERRISLITADQRTTTPRSKTDYDDHDTDGDWWYGNDHVDGDNNDDQDDECSRPIAEIFRKPPNMMFCLLCFF